MRAINAAEKTRESYDQLPYPHGDEKALNSRSWHRDLLEWVAAMRKFDQQPFSPRRILVAGCGAGTEAFDLGRQFPGAKIVAIDFSRRSIALARRLQRRDPLLRKISFMTADLADKDLPAKCGREYDLVWCHGMFSYVPSQARALQNLNACLHQDGTLYLGVNGGSHPGARLRSVVKRLGFDLSEFLDGPGARKILKLFDPLLDSTLSKMSAEYLASDIFAPFILNQSLRKWTQTCRQTGLYLLGSHYGIKQFGKVVNAGSEKLMPLGRAEVAVLLDDLAPASFHRLLFSRKPEPNPPWEKAGELAEWKMIESGLYQIPPIHPRRATGRTFKIKSPPLNLLLELHVPDAGLLLLGKSNGTNSMKEILRRASPLSSKPLRNQFYDLYQLGVINLRPPVA